MLFFDNYKNGLQNNSRRSMMVDKKNAIEVKNVSKSFRVYYDKGSQLKERILFRSRNQYESRQVLNDVSFDVEQGEAIGLIGHNGCGKSTTLKLLSRIIYPDSGSIEMCGRVSSLIELGAGFHPDMSGRENIYTNAAIFGLTKKEIDERVEDIIDFSELEEFIDNPVRTYSSGMYMRLAFSVAINVDADILLIDEILAVGDITFQSKCFDKLREIKANGTTIVIVSHSLGQIEQICDRSIWINQGKIVEDGSPRDVDPKYLEYMSKKSQNRNNELCSREKKEENKENEETQNNTEQRTGNKEAIMDKVELLSLEGEAIDSIGVGEAFQIRIKYKTVKEIDDLVVGIAIYRNDNLYVYGTNTMIDFSRTVELKSEGTIILKMCDVPLNTGEYSIDLALHRSDGFDYDFWREVFQLRVVNRLEEVGTVSIKHEWIID